MTPPAMPSFSEMTASILLLVSGEDCSISFWAFAGSQLSV